MGRNGWYERFGVVRASDIRDGRKGGGIER
jgi:hypothetical protein